ncbi:MAG: RNA polymerase sigma factor [Deltaproteobacteria bacterium]
MGDIETFYRAGKDKLFGYLVRMTANHDLSADVMQESFVRYIEHYGSGPCQYSLLYRIARNVLTDHFRRNNRFTYMDDDVVEDNCVTPEQTIVARDAFQQVLNAMQKLKPDDREILSLAAGDGNLSYQQIGEITGNSEANVKVRIHRARLKLREILKKGGA